MKPEITNSRLKPLKVESMLNSGTLAGQVVVVWVCSLMCCSMAAITGFLFTRHRGHCTPQYWGSTIDRWPKTVPQRSTVTKVFGSRSSERFRPNMTLLEATTRNDDFEDVFIRLLKQSSAALLNSYAREGFSYKAWEVKMGFLMGLISETDTARQAQLLKVANEACN